MSKVTEWYDGYSIDKGFRKVYNPFAVISYLRDCFTERAIIEGKHYWSQSVPDSLLKYYISSLFENKRIGDIL